MFGRGWCAVRRTLPEYVAHQLAPPGRIRHQGRPGRWGERRPYRRNRSIVVDVHQPFDLELVLTTARSLRRTGKNLTKFLPNRTLRRTFHNVGGSALDRPGGQGLDHEPFKCGERVGWPVVGDRSHAVPPVQTTANRPSCPRPSCPPASCRSPRWPLRRFPNSGVAAAGGWNRAGTGLGGAGLGRRGPGHRPSSSTGIIRS